MTQYLIRAVDQIFILLLRKLKAGTLMASEKVTFTSSLAKYLVLTHKKSLDG